MNDRALAVPEAGREGSGHADQVCSVVEMVGPGAEIEPISDSWRRSLIDYTINPSGLEAPRILTSQELIDVRAPVEDLVSAARHENDRLHATVGKIGYIVLLTSADGVVVDVRGNPRRIKEFRHWGVWLGGVWSETAEGTNGIGTCITEERPVTVHRTQHFRTRHTGLSCCGAPIFGVDGKLAAVLDVTSLDPAVSDRSHALALAVTMDSARVVQDDFFRQAFRTHWIAAVEAQSSFGEHLLLALDDNQRIFAADHCARLILGITDAQIAEGVSLWDYLEGTPSEILSVTGEGEAIRLRRHGDNHPVQVLVTPPREASVSATEARHLPMGLGRMGPISGGPQSWQRAASHGRWPNWRPGIDRPQVRLFGDHGVVLSNRERVIVDLIGQGKSNKEIARLLGISPETVKSHVKHLFAKLSVDKRAQAVALAQTLGLV